jgi:RNA polymerase sigma-70 factor (family 1)
MRTGDELAFSSIYRHYYPFVISKVQRLLHSPDLSEDVTQEIFIKLWEAREKLGDVKSFAAYLTTVARNHTINVLKAAARNEAGITEIVRHLNKSQATTEDEVLSNEYVAFYKRKLGELPRRSREVFLMCRDESKSYEEVAAALGISRDAVKSRMVHAMKFLRSSAQSELGIPLVILLMLIK